MEEEAEAEGVVEVGGPGPIMALTALMVPPAGTLLRMEIPEIREEEEEVAVVEEEEVGAATTVVIAEYESTVRCSLRARNTH